MKIQGSGWEDYWPRSAIIGMIYPDKPNVAFEIALVLTKSSRKFELIMSCNK